MTASMAKILYVCACFAGLTLVGLAAYRRVWVKLRGTDMTPSGCGVLLGVEMLVAAIIFDAPAITTIAFAIIAAFTAIYWIDDLTGLSALFRLVLSFLCGALIGVVFETGGGAPAWSVTIALCLAVAVLNVVLANIVNFYDGADLNLAVVILLCAGFVLWFAPRNDYLFSGALACCAFTLPFAILNSSPRTIYLGDAGSFAFASFMTFVAIVYVRDRGVSGEVAIPLALPAFDTLYVFCIRVIEKHDLLTRNYLHLYQKLNQQYRGFGYLLPQIVNAAAVLACAQLLQSLGASNLIGVVVACAVITPIFYLGCRKLLLPPRIRGEST